MTPQEIARQHAEIELAFADGAEIERAKVRFIDPKTNEPPWVPDDNPNWDWFRYIYRVKPQPKTMTLYYVQSNISGKVRLCASEPCLRSERIIKTETIPLD